MGPFTRQTTAMCGKTWTPPDPRDGRKPCNWARLRIHSTRLKIVVSPVRVRVSPSEEALDIRAFCGATRSRPGSRRIANGPECLMECLNSTELCVDRARGPVEQSGPAGLGHARGRHHHPSTDSRGPRALHRVEARRSRGEAQCKSSSSSRETSTARNPSRASRIRIAKSRAPAMLDRGAALRRAR